MNPRFRGREESAFTLLEVLVLIAVMAAIAAILLPALARPKVSSSQIRCVNHLKNIGLSFRIFTTDNGGKYPWAVSTNEGGSAEITLDASNAWKQFAPISNELSTPFILNCQSDEDRRTAVNFGTFGNTNISYFIGLQADETDPYSILSGDRNLTTNGVEVGAGLLQLGTNQCAGFSKKIHKSAGNVLLGDGSVQQVTSARFQKAVVDAAVASTNAFNRLLIP